MKNKKTEFIPQSADRTQIANAKTTSLSHALNSTFILAVLCFSIVALHAASLITSFFHGVDLTDDAYYLYNLIYPRTETPFSGFAALVSPIGSLFNHHIVGYRILALVFGGMGSIYLAASVSVVMRNRLGVELHLAIASLFAIVTASVHQSVLPTLSYNDVMMLGVTTMAAGFVRVLSGPLEKRARILHAAIVIVGTALAFQARSLSALALVVGIVAIAIPVARALGLITDRRDADWYLWALAAGFVTAILTSFLLGNPIALFETQRLMMQEGGGSSFYASTITKGGASLIKYFAANAIYISCSAGALTALFLFGGRWRTLGALVPVLALILGFLKAAEAGAWREITSAHFFAGAMAMGLFVAQTALQSDQKTRTKKTIYASIISLMLLTLPFLGSLGTSADIVFHAVLNLAPIGVLLTVPFASSHRGPVEAAAGHFAALEWLSEYRVWMMLPALIALTMTAQNLRENHSYRVQSPLSVRENVRLAAPAQLAGVRVAPETYAHLNAITDFFSQEKATPENARVLALYQSPGSVIASGLPALGPPWVFTHVGDATFNCPLITRALKTAPPKLYIIKSDDIRPDMLACLEGLGFGRAADWIKRRCVPVTTAKYSKPRNAQTCILEASRTGIGAVERVP